MGLQVDFFDDNSVSHAARRLAFCFNQSARIACKEENPLKYAGELFKSSTGLEAVPEFTRDEEAYLRLMLIETAAIRHAGQSLPVAELERQSCLLQETAVEMGLIRAKPPCCRRSEDERHFSFPGA